MSTIVDLLDILILVVGIGGIQGLWHTQEQFGAGAGLGAGVEDWLMILLATALMRPWSVFVSSIFFTVARASSSFWSRAPASGLGRVGASESPADVPSVEVAPSGFGSAGWFPAAIWVLMFWMFASSWARSLARRSMGVLTKGLIFSLI